MHNQKIIFYRFQSSIALQGIDSRLEPHNNEIFGLPEFFLDCVHLQSTIDFIDLI